MPFIKPLPLSILLVLSMLSMALQAAAQYTCTCPKHPICHGRECPPMVPEMKPRGEQEVEANITGLELCIILGLPLLECCPDASDRATTTTKYVITTTTKLATETISVHVPVTHIQKHTETTTVTMSREKTKTLTIPWPVETEWHTETKTETKLQLETTTLITTVPFYTTEKQTETKTETKTETRLDTRTLTSTVFLSGTEKDIITRTETRFETKTLTGIVTAPPVTRFETRTITTTISLPGTEKQTLTTTETRLETRTLTTTVSAPVETRTSIVTTTITISVPVTEKQTQTTTETKYTTTKTETKLTTSFTTKTTTINLIAPSRTCTGPRETVTYAFDDLSTGLSVPEHYQGGFIEFPGFTTFNTTMGPPPSPWSEYYAISPATNFTIMLGTTPSLFFKGLSKNDVFDLHSLSITSTVSHHASFQVRFVGGISISGFDSIVDIDVATLTVPKLLLPMPKCNYEPHGVKCERERVGMHKIVFKDLAGSWQNLHRLGISTDVKAWSTDTEASSTEKAALVAIDSIVVSRAIGPCI